MKKEILCVACADRLAAQNLPYDHFRFVSGKVLGSAGKPWRHLSCALCDDELKPNYDCVAFSAWTEIFGEKFVAWEQEYMLIGDFQTGGNF